MTRIFASDSRAAFIRKLVQCTLGRSKIYEMHHSNSGCDDFVRSRCYKLHVCLLHQHGSSVCHTNTKREMLCIFGQTGPPRRVDALAPLRDYRREASFPRIYNILLSLETEPRVDTLRLPTYVLIPLPLVGKQR